MSDAHIETGAPGAPAGASDSPDPLTLEDRHYRRVLDRALRLLAGREHSVRELVVKLSQRGVDAATAGLVVDDLRGRGLQSDVRFAEAFVHSRIGRGHGPVRIRQELALRGIESDVADEALAGMEDEWTALAEQARRRKFGDAPPSGRDQWNQQARFLARRGFATDVIYRILGSGGA